MPDAEFGVTKRKTLQGSYAMSFCCQRTVLDPGQDDTQDHGDSTLDMVSTDNTSFGFAFQSDSVFKNQEFRDALQQ